MNENNFNLQNFTHSIYLVKPVGEVFELLAKSEGIVKWFMGEAKYVSAEGVERKPDEFAEREDNYYWKWLNKDFSVKGKILDVQQNELLSFTFGSLFNVTITLKNKNGRTLFTLSQKYNEGALHNDFEHINCCVCWVFFMTNLKSVIENGIDLRETQANDEELVNR